MLLRINDDLVAGSVRREMFMGDEYVVAPATAARAMELNGGYVPKAEWLKSAPAWNGTPITLSHPTNDNGTPVLANDPSVMEQSFFGFFFNATAADDGDRLDGETWLNVDRAADLGEDAQTVVQQAENGEQVEVSTAYFGDRLESGEYDGEHREAVVGNLRPEHLAMLPNETGKCSIEDGCGIHASMNVSDVSVGETFVLVSADDDSMSSVSDEPSDDDASGSTDTAGSDADVDANAGDRSMINDWFEKGRNLFGIASSNSTVRNNNSNEPAESGDGNSKTMDKETREELINKLVENHGFTQDSAAALGDNCLKLTVDQFENGSTDDDGQTDGTDTTTNADGGSDDDNTVDDPTDVQAIANAVAEQVESSVMDSVEQQITEFKNEQQKPQRDALINQITEHSDLSEDYLNSIDELDELQKLANAVVPSTNTTTFAAATGARANNAGGSDDALDEVESMINKARQSDTLTADGGVEQ